MSSPGTRLDAQILATLKHHTELLTAILTRQAALEQRLPAPRLRSCDVALVLVLAATIGSRLFATCDVFERLRLTDDDGLRSALRDAGTETPRRLAWLLRRMRGVPCDGYAVVRRGDSRQGGLWQVVRV